MAKTIINVVITLIVWYYCSLTINAQSFSVLFGRTSTSSKTSGSRSSNVALVFPNHIRTNGEQPSDHERSNYGSPRRLFSILHTTLRRYFEWTVSYFTFRRDHFQESSESHSPTYVTSKHYLQYSYLHSDRSTTTLVYLHSPRGRNASQRSMSTYYGNQHHSQHPRYTRLSFGLLSYQSFHILGSPYRSYSYNIPWSYGRPSGRSHKMSGSLSHFIILHCDICPLFSLPNTLIIYPTQFVVVVCIYVSVTIPSCPGSQCTALSKLFEVLFNAIISGGEVVLPKVTS